MKHCIIFLILFAASTHFAAGQKANNAVSLENEFLKISFDKERKTYSFFERQSNEWVPVLQNATLSLTLNGADSLCLSGAAGEVSVHREKVNDDIGRGSGIILRVEAKEALWQVQFTLYNGERKGAISASVKNNSSAPWKMRDFRLLDMRGQASLFFATNNILMHCNGYQSWSDCGIVKLDSTSKHTSYWSTVLSEPEANRAVLFGFIENRRAMNTITAEKLDPRENAISVTVNSGLRTVILPPEQEWRSDKMYFSFGPSPNSLLAEYGQYAQGFADSVKKPFTPDGISTLDQRTGVPSGWCSWYYYYQNISEDSILTNLDAAAKNLKEAGMQYFQIDDGYQVCAGDWDMNSKFPHGHKWLADQIHKRGFKAGLWVAPFAVAERSYVFEEHRDWLLRTPDDSLQQFSTNASWGGRIYGLDPTLPAVRNWLTWLFEKIVNTWGYDYVKIDFLYYGAEGQSYHQPVSPVEAYRMGLSAIRRGVGSEKFILGCGAPIGPSIGFVDGMRIGPDVFAGWEGITPGVNAVAERSFYSGAVWFNDPDCLLVRDPLTIAQARAWASAIALSGQMTISSDNLASLPQDRTDIVAMAMPSYGQPAEEVDLFAPPAEQGLTIVDSDKQEIHLPAVWKFFPHDSAEFKEPSFNDSGWASMPVPSHWEDNGYPNLDGFAWYRTTFRLPADWKQGPAVFYFGKVDDCDETYLNGNLIGKSGDLPPKYNTEWPLFRIYPIPANLFRMDDENTIAVRVYDGGGPGGIYSTTEFSLPLVWNLPVITPFEKWNVTGVFNWSQMETSRELSARQLGLSMKKTYLVYEAWSDRLLGEMNGVFHINLAPTSCSLLSIHEKRDMPTILSTSRHIVQGAVDIADEKWLDDAKTLTVTSHKLLHGAYRVTMYAPEELKIKTVSGAPDHSERQVAPTIWQISFDHLPGGELKWSVTFE